MSETIINRVPIITCNPWNPVAIKNVDPYTESAIENEASIYSNNWSIEKYRPKITVIINPLEVCEWLFFNKAWWAQVIETPEDNKISVLRRGIWRGLKGIIPAGGQFIPNSILGDKEEWKKAQKKEIKKNTSDTINKIIPICIPFVTFTEWYPWSVLSRDTSRHHWIIVIIIINRPIFIRGLLLKVNDSTVPKVINNAAKAPVRGHGLTLTRWKGWFCVCIVSFCRIESG